MDKKNEMLDPRSITLPYNMKNSIRLDIIHHDKSRVEHFLNNVDEDLEQIPFPARN